MESSSASPRKLHAILSESMYDIPAWTRVLLVIAGLAGAITIAVASLTGGKETTIGVDKLIHFSGYALVSGIFVLGLRPALYVPALVCLGLLGIAIEYLQPMNTRTFDRGDLAANLLGLVIGAGLGLFLRLAGRVIITHMQRARFARQRRTYWPGAIILQQGAPVEKFFVIDRGQVQLSREVNGQRRTLGTLGPGDIFGLLGVIQNQPQYATVEALQETTVYGMEMADLALSGAGLPEPAGSVLSVMSKHLRALADRVAEAEKIVT